jgi:hypothetical protein
MLRYFFPSQPPQYTIGKKGEGRSVCGPMGREDEKSSPNARGCDVIEAPSQAIQLHKRTKISFGTIGKGIDLAKDIWTKQKHIFTSQTQVRPKTC